jgi:hypothetical protein
VITATASSGLPVTFSTNNPAVCSVNAGPWSMEVGSTTVVLVHGGTCAILVQQPGDSTFNPAAAMTQTFKVTSQLFLPEVTSYKRFSGKLNENRP